MAKKTRSEPGPEVLAALEQVRERALSLPGAEEYFPWDTHSFFREVKGRNFLHVFPKAEGLEIHLRLNPAEKRQALETGFVEPQRWDNGSDWLVVKVAGPEALETVLPWVETSYTLNKPYRVREDLLPGESAQMFDFFRQVRDLALSFGAPGEIEEYFPFGQRAFRPPKGKIFLYSRENDESLWLVLKPAPFTREFALEQPFVELPKYFGASGWIGATVREEAELEQALAWIQESFNVTNPPKKSRTRKPAAL